MLPLEVLFLLLVWIANIGEANCEADEGANELKGLGNLNGVPALVMQAGIGGCVICPGMSSFGCGRKVPTFRPSMTGETSVPAICATTEQQPSQSTWLRVGEPCSCMCAPNSFLATVKLLARKSDKTALIHHK